MKWHSTCFSVHLKHIFTVYSYQVFNVTILKHGFILHMPLINVIYWVTLTFLVSLNNLISRSNRGACPLHTICIISIIINIIIITTIQVKESIIWKESRYDDIMNGVHVMGERQPIRSTHVRYWNSYWFLSTLKQLTRRGVLLHLSTLFPLTASSYSLHHPNTRMISCMQPLHY